MRHMFKENEITKVPSFICKFKPSKVEGFVEIDEWYPTLTAKEVKQVLLNLGFNMYLI